MHTGHATVTEPFMAITSGVGKGQSGWTVPTFSGCMDMGGSPRWGLIFASEADKLNRIADEVKVDIDAEVVEALTTLQSAGKGGIGRPVNYLVWGCFDMIGGCESEHRIGTSGIRVRGEILARAGWIGGEILSSAGWIGGKVLASARWV